MQQLDLFRHVPAPVEPSPSDEVPRPVIGPDSFEDEELLAALPHAGFADSVALTAEVGRRCLSAAIPALEALCRRFSGFGADRIVPEQAAAIDALAQIAGADAAQALARLIARRTVQGLAYNEPLAQPRASVPSCRPARCWSCCATMIR